MGNTFLKYSAALIGLYFFAAYATGMGSVIDHSAGGAGTVIKALQARS